LQPSLYMSARAHGNAQASALGARPVQPPGSPEKAKKSTESHSKAPNSVVDYLRSPSSLSSMDRPSKSRGRQSSFKPLAQLRFKTLNELFPSRMHRKDPEDEPIVVEDDAGVERVIRYESIQPRCSCSDILPDSSLFPLAIPQKPPFTPSKFDIFCFVHVVATLAVVIVPAAKATSHCDAIL